MLEERKFEGRLAEAAWVGRQMGWAEPTQEEKAQIDELVRTFTNLN